MLCLQVTKVLERLHRAKWGNRRASQVITAHSIGTHQRELGKRTKRTTDSEGPEGGKEMV